MADVKWIKIVTDIFDDEKILLIESMPDADSLIVIWFKLLCLAGKQNNGGVFMISDRIHYTDEMFATIFRRNLNTVRLALDTFEKFGMIERIEGTVTIPNWEKHQQLDALEQGRENTRKRVARHREKQKLIAQGCSNVECNVTGDVTVTPCNGDRIDKNRIDKNRKEDNKNTTYSCVECSDEPSTPHEPPIISLPLNDGSEHTVTRDDFEKYQSLYPAIDVMQELRNMWGWLDGNRNKRKTRNGIRRFINAWLSKAQNNGGRQYGNNTGYTNRTTEYARLGAKTEEQQARDQEARDRIFRDTEF